MDVLMEQRDEEEERQYQEDKQSFSGKQAIAVATGAARALLSLPANQT